MNKQIYLNTHVKDLKRTMEFFGGLGFTFDKDFTGEDSAAMVVSSDITIMFLSEKHYKSFVPNKEITDTSKTSEMIICLSAESKEKVIEMCEKAFELGANRSNEPYDYGWMYGWSFEDLDGHMWEVAFIDAKAFQESKVQQ